MPYQPGPLLLQAAANVGVATSHYDFAGYTSDQLGDVESIPAGWTSFLDDATSLLTESSNPFPDVDIDSSMLTLHAYSDPAALLGINGMVAALGAADLSLGSAIGYAPAEAWVDTTAAFVPPAPAEAIGVPVIPPSAINFSVTGTAGGAPGTTVPGALPATTTVTLTNLSQYGNTNFRVGDQFQISVTGVAGQTVYVFGTQNGADFGGGPQGTIGQDGKLTIAGTMTEDSIGVWGEEWWVGPQKIQTFDFVVVGE